MVVYKWCLHCERTYVSGKGRRGSGANRGLRLCSYEDCDGDAFMDGWDWAQIRAVSSAYPVEPEPGVMYPHFGKCEGRKTIGEWCAICFFEKECWGQQ